MKKNKFTSEDIKKMYNSFEIKEKDNGVFFLNIE